MDKSSIFPMYNIPKLLANSRLCLLPAPGSACRGDRPPVPGSALVGDISNGAFIVTVHG